MRFDKFTLKAQETIQNAQQLAERFGHQQMEPEHIVRAILDQKEGVIPPLLGKIGADQNQLASALRRRLKSCQRFPVEVTARHICRKGPRPCWTGLLPKPNRLRMSS
jgi:ATP-dependent Clp protease ATP-binding subunit ClpA